jgi:hypothetical protein
LGDRRCRLGALRRLRRVCDAAWVAPRRVVAPLGSDPGNHPSPRHCNLRETGLAAAGDCLVIQAQDRGSTQFVLGRSCAPADAVRRSDLSCVARVATRPGRGFTDEPPTRKMQEEFARAAADRRYAIADPSENVETVVGEVLTRFEDGSLAYPP